MDRDETREGTTLNLVSLVSGGKDSTLMAVLIKETGIRQFPLFVDYGQRSAKLEWETVRGLFRKFSLPKPERMDLEDFGRLVKSGLTSRKLRLNEDAFLPFRNLLFLLAGAAYATSVRASGVAIGLLSEKSKIFPDQSSLFLRKAEVLFRLSLGRDVSLVAPLMECTKEDVLRISILRKIEGTYSCHSGNDRPCGYCIACREIEFASGGVIDGRRRG